MLFGKVRKAWKKRAVRHSIKNAGTKEWCAFAKALCGSSDVCQGFPYECKCCFDFYFNTVNVVQRVLEQ